MNVDENIGGYLLWIHKPISRYIMLEFARICERLLYTMMLFYSDNGKADI